MAFQNADRETFFSINTVKDFLLVNRLMTKTLIAAAGLTMMTGTSSAADTLLPPIPVSSPTPTTATSATVLASGIDLQNVDSAVRPQDDFYAYVNGKWLQKTDIRLGVSDRARVPPGGTQSHAKHREEKTSKPAVH